MHIFLDHINAMIVVAVLATVFVLLQVRGTQSNTESAVNYMVRSETLGIAEMLERDLFNMRTEEQTNAASTAGNLVGGVGFSCTGTASGDTTLSLTFPTLSNPQAISTLPDPDSAQVAIVTYQLIREPGEQISRLMGVDTLVHPLYRLERTIGGSVRGWSQSSVTYFRADFGRQTGDFVPADTLCPLDNLNRIRFQIQMARRGVEDIANDQRARSQLNFSRYGATVDLINWED